MLDRRRFARCRVRAFVSDPGLLRAEPVRPDVMFLEINTFIFHNLVDINAIDFRAVKRVGMSSTYLKGNGRHGFAR